MKPFRTPLTPQASAGGTAEHAEETQSFAEGPGRSASSALLGDFRGYT